MSALCSLYIVGFRYFCLVTFGLCGLSDWLTTLLILKGFWSFFQKLWSCLLKGKGFDCLSIFLEELFLYSRRERVFGTVRYGQYSCGNQPRCPPKRGSLCFSFLWKRWYSLDGHFEYSWVECWTTRLAVVHSEYSECS